MQALLRTQAYHRRHDGALMLPGQDTAVAWLQVLLMGRAELQRPGPSRLSTSCVVTVCVLLGQGMLAGCHPGMHV